MKPIEAKNQVSLGLGKGVRLAMSGMSYRLFRSAVTISILALAVAFLVHMLAYGILADRTTRSAWDALEDSRDFGELLSRLGTVDDRGTVIAGMLAESDARRSEYRRWSGLDEKPWRDAVAAAKNRAELLAYFDGLTPSSKAVMGGGLQGGELVASLSDAENRQRLATRAEQLKLGLPLGSMQGLDAFYLTDWPTLTSAVQRVRDGHGQAIQTFRERVSDAPANDAFADLDASALEAALSDAGYEFEASRIPGVATFAKRQHDVARLTAWAGDAAVRRAVGRATGESPAAVDTGKMLSLSLDEGGAASVAGALDEAGVRDGLSATRLHELATTREQEQRLQAVAGSMGNQMPTQEAGLLPQGRTLWLIGLSLMVCVVGVANAMFMSVTERFTEIATMKCLGAMDRFVMQMFVAEATIQGVIGGVAGVILGLLLAGLRGFAEFGGLFTQGMSGLGDAAVASLLSLIVGMVLAALAALGPAWLASRLAPMEAMRVE